MSTEFKLPPLPAPTLESTQCDSTMRYTTLRSYSELDMEAYARAAVEADRKGRVPMTKQQRDAMFAEVQRRANQLTDDGRYSFGGWFPIAVDLIESHHGIRPAGGEHGK